ncbi:hypothetical protein [Methylobacterium segetis]|nr:hypothetical protein [Methylobacterium segetis]
MPTELPTNWPTELPSAPTSSTDEIVRMPPIEARINLKFWPRPLGCKAVLTNRDRAFISIALARSLPDRFSLGLGPEFTPRPCTVVWRGERALEVVLTER